MRPSGMSSGPAEFKRTSNQIRWNQRKAVSLWGDMHLLSWWMLPINSQSFHVKYIHNSWYMLQKNEAIYSKHINLIITWNNINDSEGLIMSHFGASRFHRFTLAGLAPGLKSDFDPLQRNQKQSSIVWPCLAKINCKELTLLRFQWFLE